MSAIHEDDAIPLPRVTFSPPHLEHPPDAARAFLHVARAFGAKRFVLSDDPTVSELFLSEGVCHVLLRASEDSALGDTEAADAARHEIGAAWVRGLSLSVAHLIAEATALEQASPTPWEPDVEWIAKRLEDNVLRIPEDASIDWDSDTHLELERIKRDVASAVATDIAQREDDVIRERVNECRSNFQQRGISRTRISRTQVEHLIRSMSIRMSRKGIGRMWDATRSQSWT